MKKLLYTSLTLLLLFCANQSLSAQINRTLETKVADILAQLPTKDAKHANKLMEDILALGSEGITLFTDKLVPLGTGDDTSTRYALHTLATYSANGKNAKAKQLVEDSYLKAIEKTTHIEVKNFLIDRLIYCGSNASVTALSSYLNNEKLYQPTLVTLTTIGTEAASNAILKVAKSNPKDQAAFIAALGDLHKESALEYLHKVATNASLLDQEKALKAISEIASASSFTVLNSAVTKSNYIQDQRKATTSFINYGQRLLEKGDTVNAEKVAQLIVDNTKNKNQLHFRSAAIHLLREIKGSDYTKTLIKESKNEDKNYSGAVISAASKNLNASEVNQWIKAYKKASIETKPQILGLIAKSNNPDVIEKCISKALISKDKSVRIAGIKGLAYQDKAKSLPLLISALNMAKSEKEIAIAQQSILKRASAEDNALLAKSLTTATTNAKKELVAVLGARNAKAQYNEITGLLSQKDASLTKAVYASLPAISSKENLPELLQLLESANTEEDVKQAQKAIITVIDKSEIDFNSQIEQAITDSNHKLRYYAIFPVVDNEESLKSLTIILHSGNDQEQKAALNALSNWRNNDGLPLLFKHAIGKTTLATDAFSLYLKQVVASDYPADQKLLLVKKLILFSKTTAKKKLLIKSARYIKTFLSLVFVASYIDDSALTTTASNASIKIALPIPGKKDGLSGAIVRDIVSKSVSNLTGPDSQYIKIDVKEFLDNMSTDKGYESIFNGTNLDGWEGLVENPIARGKMSKRTLAKAQTKANAQMLRDWYVKDGVIGFKGEGYNNICTIKDYGDFEMLVDWKITNGGDSGIYLRGTPQVQIWDIARVKAGAQVGSGGLYNNQKNERIPLTVADNPINEWNTFRIKMVGERVTVYLNGVLVTDNVALENYWDRALPIFTKEAIELQAHGEDLGFRNVYVREINSGSTDLSAEEQAAGFTSLFNGKDLDHWIGNKTDYTAQDGILSVNPKQGGHGNLFTSEEYSDFIYKFDFKLTPGANNGLGIHAPLKGDVAYEGKELQILDNTAAIYKDLKEYQYHGSVYGIIAAKRGHLKPVGQWNSEEVIVKGDHIKVILNGVVIVDGNIKEASKNGPADHKNHPGLNKTKGHIAFLGHGSELWFKNIRIKDLTK